MFSFGRGMLGGDTRVVPRDGLDNLCCHSWEMTLEWPHVRRRLDRRSPRSRGATAQARPQGARRHARRPGRRGPASPRARSRGWRTDSGDPASSCCCRWRRPIGCRWTTWWERRRSATRASASRRSRSMAGPCSRSPVSPTASRPGRSSSPRRQSTPQPRAHDGYEWLYVLSGRMRLVLGDRDLVLEVGEAAEFDTQLPHWFGSTGDGAGRGAEHLRAPRRAHARPRPIHPPRSSPVTGDQDRPAARGPLLQTKLYPPRVTRALVDRPRLLRPVRRASGAGGAPRLRACRLREVHAARAVAARPRPDARCGLALPGLRRQRPVGRTGPTCSQPSVRRHRAWAGPRRCSWSHRAARRSPRS